MVVKKSYFFAILSVLFWSTVATAFKISLRYLNYPQLLFISSLTALFIQFLLILFQGNLHLVKENFLNSFLLGFLNPFLYYLILFQAYSLLPAQIAQPLNFTWPIVLTFFSTIFLKEKIRLINFLALIISFLGVLIISSYGKLFDFQNVNLLGIILALSSSFVWALYWILNLLDKRKEEFKLFGNFFFGVLFTIVFLLITNNFSFPKYNYLFGGIYVGIFEMGLTFFFFLKALRSAENKAKINNLIYLTPFLSLIFINFILKEKIYFTTILGLFLIIFGITLQTKR
ncbi:MAG: DMT family transporter [candidate division WOR-3 bacterium]|nr:DMT family transporter [candidate division WOR-3 bacterium]MCX7837242.1 DMT family transporter [candidate division WOR-3 bacterium]MDW8113493.1 DMT family transporter [candidate division WOR-3 bacterium]